jgi:hypothetical protein
MRGFVALVVGLASLVCAAVTSAAPGADDVTLRVDARFDPGTRTREITFSGRVSTGQAGEVVEVQARECGRDRFYRLIAGTRTTGGGSWALDNETGGVDMFNIPPNAYFRARWEGKFSNVVLVRVPIRPWARWNPRRRTVRVSVSNSGTGYSFRGRFVELQRDIGGGQWVAVRRARLTRTSAGTFGTVFRVPTRGLTLRVFAPDATGAPCFSSGASDTWRS